jgi:putative spermidine/putrescine transport system substrate-binding protein
MMRLQSLGFRSWLFLCCVVAPDVLADTPPLVVATWGGAYQKAQERALFGGFTEEAGVTVKPIGINNDLDAVRNYNGDQDQPFSVIDITHSSLESACAEGLLKEINAKDLLDDVNKINVHDDFLPYGIHRCGIASTAHSQIIVYRSPTDGSDLQATLQDFFDLAKWPGGRGMQKDAHSALVWSLAASGIALSEIYSALKTEEGLDQALANLDRIWPEIHWWTTGFEGLEAVKSGEVAMTTAFNTRVFLEQVGRGANLKTIWTAQQLHLDYWAIPKSAPHADLATEFIRFASTPEQIAGVSSWAPYSPARNSAFHLIADEMQTHLPTAPSNGDQIHHMDMKWWRDNRTTIEQRFAAWLARKERAKDAKPD